MTKKRKRDYSAGDKYGKLTLISFSHRNKYGQACWNVRCDCGNEKIVRISSLTCKKPTVSCGCLKNEASIKASNSKIEKKKKQIIGKKVERLTVIDFSHSNKIVTYWKCLCDCGNEVVYPYSSLSKSVVKSCGCYNNHHIDENHVILENAKTIYRGIYNDGDLKFEDFLELTKKNCHYCGAPPQNKFHISYKNSGELKKRFTTEKRKNSKFVEFKNAYFVYSGLDRIDSSKPHDKMNLVPCCKNCNQAKMDLPYVDFVLKVKEVYENLNLKEKTVNQIKDEFRKLKRRKNK